MQLPGVQAVPASDLLVGPLLAQWGQHQPYDGHPPGEIGASKLGGCSKALEYQIKGTPPSNPMTESGYHSTTLGTLVHRAIQERIAEAPPAVVRSVQIEEGWRHLIPVEGRDEPLVVASDADLRLTFHTNDYVEIVDIKTMSPFGFKMKVGEEEGPDRGHLIQCGLAMLAELEANPDVPVRGRLSYITLAELKGTDKIVKGDDYDNHTADRGNRYAEFTFDWATIETLVGYELERIAKVTEWSDAGRVVPRTIPGTTPKGAAVVGFNRKSRKGVWQHWATDDSGEPVLLKNGETWHCGYCNHRDLCMDEMESEAGNLKLVGAVDE